MTDPRQELERALSPLAWILNFLLDTLRLMFWFFLSPVLIITWCFYHPAEARLYLVSAIPLLWSGNWVTRGLLLFFLLLIASLFGKTMHRILLVDHQTGSPRWPDLVHLHDLQAGVILTPP